MKMNKVIIMSLLCGMSFGLQADATTPLMQASTLVQIKKLVEGGADVNAAIWQSEWGHYVTVLDNCMYWQGKTPPTNSQAIANLQAIIDYLNGVGAQTAGRSQYYKNNIGDLVSGSQMFPNEAELAAQAAAQAADQGKAKATWLKDRIQYFQNILKHRFLYQREKNQLNDWLGKMQQQLKDLENKS